jgi:hypothetical protein
MIGQVPGNIATNLRNKVINSSQEIDAGSISNFSGNISNSPNSLDYLIKIHYDRGGFVIPSII